MRLAIGLFLLIVYLRSGLYQTIDLKDLSTLITTQRKLKDEGLMISSLVYRGKKFYTEE